MRVNLLKIICIHLILIVPGLAQSSKTQSIKSIYETSLEITPMEYKISDIFAYIEDNTPYKFAYDIGQIEPDRLVYLSESNKDVAFYLYQISKEANLQFQQVNNEISVKKIEEIENATENYIKVKIDQTRVEGIVKDDSDGSAIPGVNIVEKGTNNGIMTDANGYYSINIPEGAILVFSSVGYESQEINVGGRSVIDITLSQNVQQLADIVVIGYGVQEKSDVTGAVASFDMEDMARTASNNILDALKGRVAGLDITQGNNRPGAESQFLVRGMNSISASNQPLIILDGSPYFGDFNAINPNDISSIEILKDASSAAIYGSRGSNGVILITSKRGTTSKPSINYTARFGIQDQDSRTLQMMDVDGYINKAREHARYQLGDRDRWQELLPASFIENYENGEIVDWVDDMVVKHAFQQEHNLNISGNAENMNYFTSLNMLKDNGVYYGSSYQRINFRTNLNYTVNEWISFGTSTMVAQTDQGGYSADYMLARILSPFADYYDENGDLALFPMGIALGKGHPMALPTYDTKDDVINTLFSNLNSEIKIPFIKGLKYKLNYGLNMAAGKVGTYNTTKTLVGLNQGGIARITDNNRFKATWENLIIYDNNFGKHNVNFTGLYSRERTTMEEDVAIGTNFPNDLLGYRAIQTAENQQVSSDYQESMLISYMARLNYNYDSRYLLTLTLRRDGFSGFGALKKWGNFPSVAVGWNIHREGFLTGNNVISNLRLRASYGINGNQGVTNPYAYLQQLSVKPYIYGDASASTIGFIPSQMANADLGWESTHSFNLGLDFGIMEDRFTGSIEFFRSNTSDLLLQRNVPLTNGVGSVLQNIGKTKNKGFEITLNSSNITRKDFSWNTGLNFFTNQNEIVELFGGGEDDIANRWFIGESIRVAYYRNYDGLWQEGDDMSIQPGAQPGFFKGVDTNQDGIVDAQDMIVWGSRDPDFTGGITNTISWKGFDMTIVLHARIGGWKTNDAYSYFQTQFQNGGDANFVYFNYFDIDYWTPENTDAKAPAIYQPYNYYMLQMPEKASFVRLREVSLRYTVPNSLLEKTPVKGLNFFLTGRNLHTWTKFTGDPELNSNIDYPMTRNIVLGLNLSL